MKHFLLHKLLHEVPPDDIMNGILNTNSGHFRHSIFTVFSFFHFLDDVKRVISVFSIKEKRESDFISRKKVFLELRSEKQMHSVSELDYRTFLGYGLVDSNPFANQGFSLFHFMSSKQLWNLGNSRTHKETTSAFYQFNSYKIIRGSYFVFLKGQIKSVTSSELTKVTNKGFSLYS